MRSRTGVLAAAGLAGVCLVACGAADGALPGSAAGPGWRVVARVATPGRQPVLVSADAPSPKDAWALGFDVPDSNLDLGLAVPVLEHWNGRDWRRIGVPARARRKFAMLDPFDITIRVSPGSGVWLFGSSWLRFAGDRWRWGALPVPGHGWDVSTDDAVVLGRGDVWVFGTALRGSVYRPYAAHFDGVRWSSSAMPGRAPVAAASVVSPRDMWAVLGRPAADLTGSGRSAVPASGGRVVRWNGIRWARVALPSSLSRRGYLTSVLAHGDRDVWVAGGLREGRAVDPAVARWDGSRWRVERLPLPGRAGDYVVSSLARDGHGGAWAAGVCVACGTPSPALIWHLRGGRWSAPVKNYAGRLATPFALAQVADTSSVWGVGLLSARSVVYGLIALSGRTPR